MSNRTVEKEGKGRTPAHQEKKNKRGDFPVGGKSAIIAPT